MEREAGRGRLFFLIFRIGSTLRRPLDSRLLLLVGSGGSIAYMIESAQHVAEHTAPVGLKVIFHRNKSRKARPLQAYHVWHQADCTSLERYRQDLPTPTPL